MLERIKTQFGFENDQEFFEIFNFSFVDQSCHTQSFETKCLISLIERIGLSRKHFMELLLILANNKLKANPKELTAEEQEKENKLANDITDAEK